MESEGLSCKWNQLYWDMPSCDTILSQPENRIHVAKDCVTISHFPEKKTWIATSWSKFICKNDPKKDGKIYKHGFSDDQPANEMRQELEKISNRFLAMENNNEACEKIYFRTKMLWKKNGDAEDIKYTRALKYLFDQMRLSFASDHKSLIYLTLNIIFFNKTAQ